MAEGFAIFGAINGAIGVSLALRNGVKTFYQDVHGIKRAKSEAQEKLQTLDIVHNRLVDWQDKWMAWNEDEHSRLHRHLWGSRDNGIHEMIIAIKGHLEPLAEKFESMLHSRRRRWSYVIFRKDTLSSDLGELETKITRLETEADSAFHQKHSSDASGTKSSGLIKWFGEAFQLVSLAKDTHNSSEDLYTACKESSPEAVLDMGLNFFYESQELKSSPDYGTEKQRSKARLMAISASAKESKLHFTFLATDKRLPDPFIRIQIKLDTSLRENEYQHSLPRAFDKIICKESRKMGFTTPGNNSAHRFVIRDAPDGKKWEFESFREVLSRPHQYDVNTQQNFIYLAKLKVALELVDCGLLLLQTSWLSELCSCALRRHDADLRKGICTIRVTEVDHIIPRCEDIQPNNCWCMQDPMRGMYVRRLGVLLVELALETPVFDVALATSSTDLELSFLDDWPAQPQSARQWPRETFLRTVDRLKKAKIPKDYREVVKYCLQCTWTRERVLNNESFLREYYWEILQP